MSRVVNHRAYNYLFSLVSLNGNGVNSMHSKGVGVVDAGNRMYVLFELFSFTDLRSDL